MSKDLGPSGKDHLRGIGGEKAQRYLRKARRKIMADKTPYTVKKIRGGINDGKYGVYLGNNLKIVFNTKGAATADKNRRNREEGRG